MLKLYCKAAFLGGLLCVFSPTRAQPVVDINGTCEEYHEEVLRLREQHVQSGLDESTFRLGRVNPAHVFLEPVMRNLDQEARERVGGQLAGRVWYNCLNLEESGLSSESKLSESLERAIEYFDLDMSKPRWGLVDLPRIDFDTMTLQEVSDIIDILSDLPLEDYQNPVNNVFAVAFLRYLKRFDLSSSETDEKVQRLITGFSFLGGPEHADKPVSETLDELAVELGLKFRLIED